MILMFSSLLERDCEGFALYMVYVLEDCKATSLIADIYSPDTLPFLH